MKRLGRYEILRELGHGAMGRVFLGLDPQIGRDVALKTVNLFQLDTNLQEEFCKRFFHEAQAAGRLLHPGIVTIFDVGEDPATKTPFLVLEYVEGSTLEMVMSERRYSRGSALQVAREIAEALDFAHAHGIVHRDIKPSNILLTREGRAKITDFGVARLPTAPSTDTGAVLGTPHYMAPEQLGGKRVDGRTDLFALGTILYRLLSGVEPFAGDSLSNVFFQIMFTDPAPVSSLEPELGPDFDYVLDRALAKEPARRYQKGAEFAADLEDLQLGAPPRSRAALRKAPEEEPEPAAPPPESPVPAATTQHRKTPTVRTEPMASWPLVATT
ncbi:MAG: serine/threonine-protein kinase, partial [Candidatus Acidiferrales bacterium]